MWPSPFLRVAAEALARVVEPRSTPEETVAVGLRLAWVRSHCRFRNRGTEYVGESGIKWMSGGTKRQRGQALGLPSVTRTAMSFLLATT